MSYVLGNVQPQRVMAFCRLVLQQMLEENFRTQGTGAQLITGSISYIFHYNFKNVLFKMKNIKYSYSVLSKPGTCIETMQKQNKASDMAWVYSTKLLEINSGTKLAK